MLIQCSIQCSIQSSLFKSTLIFVSVNISANMCGACGRAAAPPQPSPVPPRYAYAHTALDLLPRCQAVVPLQPHPPARSVCCPAQLPPCCLTPACARSDCPALPCCPATCCVHGIDPIVRAARARARDAPRIHMCMRMRRRATALQWPHVRVHC